jgi:hypothetical protein
MGGLPRFLRGSLGSSLNSPLRVSAILCGSAVYSF